MANVAVMQLDGKIPNLALMQIASYHKRIGDTVRWWDGPLFPSDKVYASKIFDFTDLDLPEYVVLGGTGVDVQRRLPEEMNGAGIAGAWSLYPKYKNHVGFSERGCRLNCKFCVVPQKDGRPTKAASIEELLNNPLGEDRLVLLDDDFLGHPEVEDVFEELIDRDLTVNFICGLNIRLITERQAELLSRTKFINNSFGSKQVSFAWDNIKDERLILRGFNRCVEAGVKPREMQFFVLIGYDSTHEQDMHRVQTIRDLGSDPFVMAYDRKVQYQKDFQRWVNHRAIFNSVKFEDYKPATKKERKS